MNKPGIEAWAGILKVHAAVVPQLDLLLQREHNLPLTWYDVLLELNAAPGRQLTMTELGQRAVVSRTRVSRVVDELTRQGLVVRETNPEDGRSAYAVLTPEGRARLRVAAPTYLEGIRRFFSQYLSQHGAACMAQTLGRVLDRLEHEAR